MQLTNLKPLILSFLVLFLSACSDSNEPQAGKHYSALPDSVSELNLPAITEVFSLTCGHCRNMEKAIPEIEKLTGEKVGKVHVTFNESAQIGALLYYSAEMQLGEQPDHQFVEELFEVVQRQEGTMTEKQADIEKIFTSRKLISPYHLDSSHVAELDKYMTLAENVTEKAKINSVPSFIIDGRYILITEGHDDIPHLSETINYLLAKSK